MCAQALLNVQMVRKLQVPANAPTALEFGVNTVGLDRDRTLEIVEQYQPLLEEAMREDDESDV